jgi:hypothetical protein
MPLRQWPFPRGIVFLHEAPAHRGATAHGHPALFKGPALLIQLRVSCCAPLHAKLSATSYAATPAASRIVDPLPRVRADYASTITAPQGRIWSHLQSSA